MSPNSKLKLRISKHVKSMSPHLSFIRDLSLPFLFWGESIKKSWSVIANLCNSMRKFKELTLPTSASLQFQKKPKFTQSISFLILFYNYLCISTIFGRIKDSPSFSWWVSRVLTISQYNLSSRQHFPIVSISKFCDDCFQQGASQLYEAHGNKSSSWMYYMSQHHSLCSG